MHNKILIFFFLSINYIAFSQQDDNVLFNDKRVYTASSFHQSLQDIELINNVKDIKKVTLKEFDANNKYALNTTNVYEFNNAQVVSKNYLLSDYKEDYKYKYNKKNRLIAIGVKGETFSENEFFKYKKKKLISKSIASENNDGINFTYGYSKDKIVVKGDYFTTTLSLQNDKITALNKSSVDFKGDSQLDEKGFTYNSNGKLASSVYKKTKKDALYSTEKITYTYNDEGVIRIKKVLTHKEKRKLRLPETTYAYEYIYDEYNNWIAKFEIETRHLSKIRFIYLRTIQYKNKTTGFSTLDNLKIEKKKAEILKKITKVVSKNSWYQKEGKFGLYADNKFIQKNCNFFKLGNDIIAYDKAKMDTYLLENPKTKEEGKYYPLLLITQKDEVSWYKNGSSFTLLKNKKVLDNISIKWAKNDRDAIVFDASNKPIYILINGKIAPNNKLFKVEKHKEFSKVKPQIISKAKGYFYEKRENGSFEVYNEDKTLADIKKIVVYQTFTETCLYDLETKQTYTSNDYNLKNFDRYYRFNPIFKNTAVTWFVNDEGIIYLTDKGVYVSKVTSKVALNQKDLIILVNDVEKYLLEKYINVAPNILQKGKYFKE